MLCTTAADEIDLIPFFNAFRCLMNRVAFKYLLNTIPNLIPCVVMCNFRCFNIENTFSYLYIFLHLEVQRASNYRLRKGLLCFPCKDVLCKSGCWRSRRDGDLGSNKIQGPIYETCSREKSSSFS